VYKWGFRFEAFAAPANRVLALDPNSTYCTMFPDTDVPLGSLGEFYAVTESGPLPAGHWFVYIDCNLAEIVATIIRVTSMLKRDTGPRAVLFITSQDEVELVDHHITRNIIAGQADRASSIATGYKCIRESYLNSSMWLITLNSPFDNSIGPVDICTTSPA